MNADWERLRAVATEEIEGTLMGLPAPLREPAAKLPVTFERQPSKEFQAEGIGPDTLGLFVGPDFVEEGGVPMPSQIILFLGNLWEFAGEEEQYFREEVRTTFLHELGHYLGLDEEGLAERGVE